MRRITAGLGALILSAALLVGLPAALVFLAGNPIPSWDRLMSALTMPDYGGEFLVGSHTGRPALFAGARVVQRRIPGNEAFDRDLRHGNTLLGGRGGSLWRMIWRLRRWAVLEVACCKGPSPRRSWLLRGLCRPRA